LIAGTIGLFAAAMTANLLTMRIFDRRPLADIGLGTGHGAGRNFAIGVGLGAVAAAIMLALPLVSGAGHLVFRTDVAFSWGRLLFYLATLLFGATGEEMLFRGYGFQLLIQKIGPFATVLPIGVLFGLAHSTNPHSTALSAFNTSLWGILLGVAFLRSRDLWLPIGIHFGWNAVLPLFGVNLSGLTIDVTRDLYRWDVSPVWSGGAYGPEGGLLATIFAILVLVALFRVPVRPQPAVIATVLNEPES
jgi:membrane protease YdiL (CAAX protease family)